MHKTGIEEHFVLKDGKKLFFGYTTGTCAAAAAKAAVYMLLTGKKAEYVHISTPKGIELELETEDAHFDGKTAVCAVRKYSGDDPDVTDGLLIYAKVRLTQDHEIKITGGKGVGRVTKPGLKQRIGEPAINPVPMEMIRRAASEAMDDIGESCGAEIEISVPNGEETAKKTFNPKLGITGGISILGTSGIVEPMSEEALVGSIELEIRQKHTLGEDTLLLTPGNYGADFLRNTFGIHEDEQVKCSNFIGRALDAGAAAGFRRILLTGHIGKLVKLSGGIMNTHSREGDARAELMAGCALMAGADAELCRCILGCVTTDEMLRIMKDADILEKCMSIMGEKIYAALKNRVREQAEVGYIVFSEEYGVLCMSDNARHWIDEHKKR